MRFRETSKCSKTLIIRFLMKKIAFSFFFGPGTFQPDVIFAFDTTVFVLKTEIARLVRPAGILSAGGANPFNGDRGLACKFRNSNNSVGDCAILLFQCRYEIYSSFRSCARNFLPRVAPDTCCQRIAVRFFRELRINCVRLSFFTDQLCVR